MAEYLLLVVSCIWFQEHTTKVSQTLQLCLSIWILAQLPAPTLWTAVSVLYICEASRGLVFCPLKYKFLSGTTSHIYSIFPWQYTYTKGAAGQRWVSPPIRFNWLLHQVSSSISTVCRCLVWSTAQDWCPVIRDESKGVGVTYYVRV